MEILVIFRGVPAFRPLYLENYGLDLYEIYNSHSQINNKTLITLSEVLPSVWFLKRRFLNVNFRKNALS